MLLPILLGGSAVLAAASGPATSPSPPLRLKLVETKHPFNVRPQGWLLAVRGRRRRTTFVPAVHDDSSGCGVGGGDVVPSVPRGGGAEVASDDGGCLDYLAVGLVDLSGSPDASSSNARSTPTTSEVEEEGRGLGVAVSSGSIVGEAIRRLLLSPLSSSSGSAPRLACVPAGSEGRASRMAASHLAVTYFPPPSRQFDLGSSHETLGCLSDVVVLRLTDLGTARDEGNLLRIVDCVSGVLDGAERRSAVAGGDGERRRTKQNMVVLVDASESVEKRRVVESVLEVRLDSMGSSPAEGGKDGYHYVDLAVVTEDGSAGCLSALERACGLSDYGTRAGEVVEKDVPLGAFPHLCGSVYRALGGAAVEGVTFETVDVPLPVAIVGEDDKARKSVEVYTEVETESAVSSENHGETDDSSSDTVKTPRPPPPPEPPIIPENRRSELLSLSESVRASAEERIDALSSKMDEVEFDPEGKMPILEFGRDAEWMLEKAAVEWDEGIAATLGEGLLREQEVQDERHSTLASLAGPAQLGRLHARQLQSLREYYGRRYERSLDGALEEYRSDCRRLRDGGGDGDGEERGPDAYREKAEKLKGRLNAALGDAAGRAAEGFRAAASNAVPGPCREGGVLRDGAGAEYGYAAELAGLLRDVQEVTGLRAEEVDEADDDEEEGEGDMAEVVEEEEGGVRTKRKRLGPSRWYEKLAARALVLGVNYAQGWLALQGLKRAAAERDRAMPKFPLF